MLWSVDVWNRGAVCGPYRDGAFSMVGRNRSEVVGGETNRGAIVSRGMELKGYFRWMGEIVVKWSAERRIEVLLSVEG